MELWIQDALLVLGSLFVGGYLRGYMSKKGENLATHEDIDKLVEQVKAVTQATKDIEARISDDVWNRQKRWEIKREALIEVVRSVSSASEALSSMGASYKGAVESGTPDASHWLSSKAAAIDVWNNADGAFRRAHAVAEIVCGPEVKKTLNNLNLRIRTIVGEIFKNDTSTYYTSLFDLNKDMEAVTAAARKELGIDDKV